MGDITTVLQAPKRTEKWKIRNTDFYDGNSCKVADPYESNDYNRKEAVMVKELEMGYMLKLVFRQCDKYSEIPAEGGGRSLFKYDI